jgi:hypothetical protein
MKTCRIKGCNNKYLAQGYCKKHYQRVRKHGNPFYEYKKEIKKCKVNDCTSTYYDNYRASGYCKKHYQRIKRHGNPNINKRVDRDSICTVEECNNKHRAKGYCSKHYEAWYKHGNPLINLLISNKKCSIEGCNKKHKGKGYCQKHYEAWHKHGDPLYNPPQYQIKKCKADGCVGTYHNTYYATGYCRKHALRLLKTGSIYLKEKKKYKLEICKVKGCTNTYYNSRPDITGYCSKHYMKVYRHGDPLFEQKITIGCKIEGCKNKHDSLGYCSKHYVRFKTGTLDKNEFEKILKNLGYTQKEFVKKTTTLKKLNQKLRRMHYESNNF